MTLARVSHPAKHRASSRESSRSGWPLDKDQDQVRGTHAWFPRPRPLGPGGGRNGPSVNPFGPIAALSDSGAKDLVIEDSSIGTDGVSLGTLLGNPAGP
jgi:hypothetical protein